MSSWARHFAKCSIEDEQLLGVFLHQGFPPKTTPTNEISWGPKLRGPTFPSFPGMARLKQGALPPWRTSFRNARPVWVFRCFGLLVFFEGFCSRRAKKKHVWKMGSPPKKKQILGKMEGWMEVWWCPKIFVFKSYQVESRADWIDVIYVYHTYFYLILMLNVGNCIHGSYGRPWFKWDLIFFGVIKKLFPTDGVQPEWLENSMKKTRGEH